MIGNEISKEDAAAYLRNQGLKAEVSNGVVVAYMPLADALKPKAMEKLRKMLAGDRVYGIVWDQTGGGR